MKIFTLMRKSATSFLAMLLVLSLSCETFAASHQARQAAAANQQGGSTTGGTGRGDNGQTLRVSVSLNGKPVGHAIVRVKVADGSVVLSGFTLANGIFSRSLNAGIYTVTATSGKNSATSPITVVQSNDPLMVPLALTPTAP